MTRSPRDGGDGAPPVKLTSARECVAQVIEVVGKEIRLGLPLGLGKANRLANAFYRAACEDPEISLTIFTGLSLQPPDRPGGLPGRFFAPVRERLYDGYVELDYEKARRAGALPDNVIVEEFFLSPGTYLKNDGAQQNYISANYTHVIPLLREKKINVIAQMIAPGAGGKTVSLSCNPDLSLDVIPHLHERRAGGEPAMVLGELNENLPFMPNDAEVPAAWFDLMLDAGPQRLFATPSESIDLCEHAIGLNASALVRDGGTLQIGIGSLGDAVVHALKTRHERNADYRAMLSALERAFDNHAPVEALGGRDVFDAGLYGCSEMVFEGFLALIEAGILARKVDHEDGPGGIVLDGGFYFGRQCFYDWLHALDESTRRAINMTSVARVNQLYGGEAGRRAQRLDGRFINNAIKVTALGAVVSDALEDGRVVSGVGGQYNFVAMAYELANARSVIAIRSTRTSKGDTVSNIIWDYCHVTVPRHLRDIVVTEYGIADLRGQPDREVIARLLSVCDSRFQPALLAEAKKAGKIEADYEIPAAHRRNSRARLRAALMPFYEKELLPAYPFGSEFSPDEQWLIEALRDLDNRTARPLDKMRAVIGSIRRFAPPDELAGPLARMDLTRPARAREKIWQMLLSEALLRTRWAAPKD